MSQSQVPSRPAAKNRLSRKKAKVIAAAAAAISFSVPWIAFRVAPAPMASSSQVVVVPAGSRVTVIRPVGGAPNVTVVTAKGSPTAASAPVAATTGASAVPKP